MTVQFSRDQARGIALVAIAKLLADGVENGHDHCEIREAIEAEAQRKNGDPASPLHDVCDFNMYLLAALKAVVPETDWEELPDTSEGDAFNFCHSQTTWACRMILAAQ